MMMPPGLVCKSKKNGARLLRLIEGTSVGDQTYAKDVGEHWADGHCANREWYNLAKYEVSDAIERARSASVKRRLRAVQKILGR